MEISKKPRSLSLWPHTTPHPHERISRLAQFRGRLGALGISLLLEENTSEPKGNCVDGEEDGDGDAEGKWGMADEADGGEGDMEWARAVMMSMSRGLGSSCTCSPWVRMMCAKSFTTRASTNSFS